MLKSVYTTQFKKDYKCQKRRQKNLSDLRDIINQLACKKTLLPKYKDHSLKGDYSGCRECHIEPDWLLIYLIDGAALKLIRTGTHSDLFK